MRKCKCSMGIKLNRKSVGTRNCLVNHILQNICFGVQQKKYICTCLEQLEGEYMMTQLQFLGELSLKVSVPMYVYMCVCVCVYIYIYIYSGYGKYSDPLTFFTLCYIAAIC